jgi:cell division protein FtsI (penicillin-binding protein 3)
VDFSAQPEESEESSKAAENKDTEQKLPEVTVAVDEGGDISVPDFTGKTMREVTEACLRLGLDPVLVGSGVASQQVPAAGTKVRRGTKMTAQFGPEPAHMSKTR